MEVIMDSKFWMVKLKEVVEDAGIFELSRVFFYEDRHQAAREYVYRMNNADYGDGYRIVAADPVLVDELDVTDYNGDEYLDHIRGQQNAK